MTKDTMYFIFYTIVINVHVIYEYDAMIDVIFMKYFFT